MSRNASASPQGPVPKPREFDWFVGLLYAIGAIGFIAIAAIFIFLLSP